MWIDRKYCNLNWNPCIDQEFTIKGVTYRLIAHGKKNGVPFWNMVDEENKKEYDIFESELYNKLVKHGII